MQRVQREPRRPQHWRRYGGRRCEKDGAGRGQDGCDGLGRSRAWWAVLCASALGLRQILRMQVGRTLPRGTSCTIVSATACCTSCHAGAAAAGAVVSGGSHGLPLSGTPHRGLWHRAAEPGADAAAHRAVHTVSGPGLGGGAAGWWFGLVPQLGEETLDLHASAALLNIKCPRFTHARQLCMQPCLLLPPPPPLRNLQHKQGAGAGWAAGRHVPPAGRGLAGAPACRHERCPY